MEAIKEKKSNIFSGHRIAFFGYDTFDAAKNMAIDEVLMNLAALQNRFFIRFYNVDKPSIILGKSDHASLIKTKERDTYGITRRITGGRPIYLDENTLQYSISGPLDDPKRHFAHINLLHKALGPILADSIREIIGADHEITLGRTSSVRIDGKPIAGHGQATRRNEENAKDSFLYHGVIVINPWNLEIVDRILQISKEDYNEMRGLPSLSYLAGNHLSTENYKGLLLARMVKKLPEQGFGRIQDAEKAKIISEAEKLCAKTYCNPEHVFDYSDSLRRDTKFCILYEDQNPQQAI